MNNWKTIKEKDKGSLKIKNIKNYQKKSKSK